MWHIGQQKANEHTRLFGIVLGKGGGHNCLCVAFFLGVGKETHKHNSQKISGKVRNSPGTTLSKSYWGKFFFLLTVGAFLLTVELLCLQSIKVLLRGTFPLSQKPPTVRKQAPIVSKKAPKHNCE